MDEHILSLARTLGDALKNSDEAREVQRLKAIAYEDATNAQLLSEYKKTQVRLQTGVLSGASVDSETMTRFTRISSLLMMNNDAKEYLMAEMRLQQTYAKIVNIISEGAGINMSDYIPG